VTPSNYSRRARAALILSSDTLGAALLGAALELLGYRAVFPRDDEGGADALRRLKPRVVLVDGGDEFLNDSTVLGPALMTRAQLVFFGKPARVRDLRVLAAKYGASLLALPDDVDRLADVLSRPPQTERLTGR
jgi:hypothetical protein